MGEFHLLTKVFLACASTALLKTLFFWFNEKKLNISRFYSSGGMPSVHSAVVSALTFSVGFHEGFSSTIFAATLVFSLIIIYDATDIRYAAGKQAEILNKIISDFYRTHTLEEEKLKELLGHTPKEVFVGIVIGLLFALT